MPYIVYRESYCWFIIFPIIRWCPKEPTSPDYHRPTDLRGVAGGSGGDQEGLEATEEDIWGDRVVDTGGAGATTTLPTELSWASLNNPRSPISHHVFLSSVIILLFKINFLSISQIMCVFSGFGQLCWCHLISEGFNGLSGNVLHFM